MIDWVVLHSQLKDEHISPNDVKPISRWMENLFCTEFRVQFFDRIHNWNANSLPSFSVKMRKNTATSCGERWRCRRLLVGHASSSSSTVKVRFFFMACICKLRLVSFLPSWVSSSVLLVYVQTVSWPAHALPASQSSHNLYPGVTKAIWTTPKNTTLSSTLWKVWRMAEHIEIELWAQEDLRGGWKTRSRWIPWAWQRRRVSPPAARLGSR